jgi:superfamily II DNA/RNA helicase
MSFDSLGLHPALALALSDAGYAQATDVQTQAIPAALQGADLRVSAATGSGKTAAFALPALHKVLAARGDASKRREKGIVHGPRALVLAPTRELALQVAKAFTVYGRHVQGLRVATVVGGVPYGAQLKALRGPLDVLIATPGRLMDHMASGKAVLANVEMFVLDEADRMLDMGFIDDIRHIAEHLPEQRQTVMFSATFAGAVGHLARQMLAANAQTIAVANHTDTHANIEQRLHWADDGKHKHALLEQLLAAREIDQAVVFTSTQQDADWLADRLAQIGHPVASLHGGMPQGRRNRVLQGLRQRNLRVLVATDVAARGIDVPSISHVINWGLPMKAEDYVHRIGRTGRAGRSGLAITLAERRDIGMIKRIQQFTTQQIPVTTVEGLEPRMAAPVLFNRPARPQRAQHTERREWSDRRERVQHSFGHHNAHHAQRPPFPEQRQQQQGFARHEGGFAPRQDSFVRAEDHREAPQSRRPWPARDEQRAPKREGGFQNKGFKPGFKVGFKKRDSAPAANNPGFATKRPKRAA